MGSLITNHCFPTSLWKIQLLTNYHCQLTRGGQIDLTMTIRITRIILYLPAMPKAKFIEFCARKNDWREAGFCAPWRLILKNETYF